MWGRLCKCLQEEFLPYTSLSILFAQRECYVSVDNNPNVADESVDDGMTPTIGSFGVRASVLEEKALARKMLCCYAAELKGGVHLWISEVATILVIPLIL